MKDRVIVVSGKDDRIVLSIKRPQISAAFLSFIIFTKKTIFILTIILSQNEN